MKVIDADLLWGKIKAMQACEPNYANCFLNEAQNLSTEWECIEDMLESIDVIEYTPKIPHGYWMQTEETVWDAKESDGVQNMTISIVTAKCSVCKRWAEQVNQFPPYMHYDRCPHCGAIMYAKPPKKPREVET